MGTVSDAIDYDHYSYLTYVDSIAVGGRIPDAVWNNSVNKRNLFIKCLKWVVEEHLKLTSEQIIKTKWFDLFSRHKLGTVFRRDDFFSGDLMLVLKLFFEGKEVSVHDLKNRPKINYYTEEDLIEAIRRKLETCCGVVTEGDAFKVDYDMFRFNGLLPFSDRLGGYAKARRKVFPWLYTDSSSSSVVEETESAVVADTGSLDENVAHFMYVVQNGKRVRNGFWEGVESKKQLFQACLRWLVTDYYSYTREDILNISWSIFFQRNRLYAPVMHEDYYGGNFYHAALPLLSSEGIHVGEVFGNFRLKRFTDAELLDIIRWRVIEKEGIPIYKARETVLYRDYSKFGLEEVVKRLGGIDYVKEKAFPMSVDYTPDLTVSRVKELARKRLEEMNLDNFASIWDKNKGVLFNDIESSVMNNPESLYYDASLSDYIWMEDTDGFIEKVEEKMVALGYVVEVLVSDDATRIRFSWTLED